MRWSSSVAADERVELAGSRALGQVQSRSAASGSRAVAAAAFAAARLGVAADSPGVGPVRARTAAPC